MKIAVSGSELSMANDWLCLFPLPSLTQWIAIFFPPELSLRIITVVTVSQGSGLGWGALQQPRIHTHTHSGMSRTEPGVITNGLSEAIIGTLSLSFMLHILCALANKTMPEESC